MVEQEQVGTDRGWTIAAFSALAGIIVVSCLLGFVVIPVVQGQSAGIGAWLAICRAIGVSPGSPARPEPPVTAQAAPVSLVAWRPDILEALAHGDRARGAEISARICASCHGDGGVSPSPDYPLLSGQSAAAIYKQLHDFRSGARANPVMTPIVVQLNDRDMADVAAYFARGALFGSLGPRLSTGNRQVEHLANMGDPHRLIPACNACHSAGVGGPIETPTLTGQYSAYLRRELQLFATAQRSNDVYARMRTIAARLTEDERQGLADYYQGIR